MAITGTITPKRPTNMQNASRQFQKGELALKPAKLYAVSSAANNNGSAFAGLSANSPFWNCLLAFCMFVGRFGVIVPVMAIAANKQRTVCR